MTNVISIRQFTRLMFTEDDKKFLNQMSIAFASQGLPHELVYGVTDENQEWCLVRKLTQPLHVCREACEFCHTLDSYIVAEICVTPMGYRHQGSWGNLTQPTLRLLFDRLMPEAYNDVKARVR